MIENMIKLPVISIVVPCYNEEEVLPETAARLTEKLRSLKEGGKVAEQSNIVFTDDGSADATWEIITKLHNDNKCICGIKLSKNQGHQNALLAGLLSVKSYADAAISIDADLQDDIDVIDRMIEKYKAGFEVVCGVRGERKSDTFFKRVTAQMFYRLMSMLGVDIIYNHADFRLLGKNALAALSQYREVNLFLRALVPMLGFKTSVEYYERTPRLAGESKYPFTKMLRFAIEGITSFSIKPVRFITMLGMLLFLGSIAAIIYFFVRYHAGHTVTGWASLACSIWGIGGLILFSIGIVGEYVGKTYMETKARPRYIIEQILGDINEK